ncbi:MAG: hypothetical protein GTN62_11365 [Gemmatimonadales bacterium]|nr:hypothetical protein [Gemmatimonadales bacterium]NIN50693.1 hypothetical protein [Gemmatimonadales bacterium]NIP08157.1 hypothetical protein [Gemmatimonadales bacterium]NIR01035.1 hypothetical protein [Gemmatimonadales bacterium]NIS65114.1 hypothetical protein [Gemmatimonadales bacterium]
MCTRIGFLVLLAATAASAPASGQERQARADSLERELRLLKARVDSLQRVLAELVGRGRDTTRAQDELAALRAAARAAAGAGEAGTDTARQEGSRTRNLQILNPEISVTGDIVGSFTAPDDEENQFSATPREFEFSFQSALDPYTRTKIFITREEDFEIAGLPEEEGEEEGGGFEIEEGYMYWVGLPGGLGVKLGKFRQEIGLYNRWHTHALQEIERPLAAAAFLGEDGLIQTGASLTLPSISLGPATQTVTFETTRGSNEALFGGGNEISFLGRLQSFWDLGASTFQLGATGVLGENDDESLESRMLGLDFSFRWAPPRQALYRDFQLKGEWYFVEQDVDGTELSGSGGYLQASARLTRRWIVGARADYLEAVGSDAHIVQIAPSITWWQSEWVRLRLQYNYLKPEGGSGNHTILLQSVWAVGPHKHETY